MVAASAGSRILLVEDDADLCAGWQELFSLLGHEVVCHQRAQDALADSAGISSADVFISDFYLPDLNGVELIQRIRERRPELKAILLTGSRDASVIEAARKIPNCAIVHKPVNIDDLAKLL